MKRPDNTEIDRLLRRHARPGGGAVSAAGGRAGAHMDADEMNAYAEGALPDGARSRYFAHLSDCDSCRKLVTQLTLAAVVDAEGRERAAAAAVATAAPSKSWRERLAAIFSPPVLRYALPALALFAVVAVALVAMRANRGDSYVATKQAAPDAGPGIVANTGSAAQPAAKPEGGENHSTGSANASNVYDGQTVTQQPAPSATPDPATAEKAPADRDGPAAGQARLPEENMAQTDVSKAPSREDEAKTGATRAQDEVSAAPPPPRPVTQQEPARAAPPAADAAGERDKEERQAKTAGKDDGNVVPAGGGVASETQPNKGRAEVGTASATPAAPSARIIARKRSTADESARNERAGETRDAGGRSFQRQRGVWVDTAYNSSRPTTKVRRGSEHYRTLVADEPGLRAIVEKLGGEVIVVWNGRAYHFH